MWIYEIATAKRHGLTLATRNVSDLENTGARLVNPFDTTRVHEKSAEYYA